MSKHKGGLIISPDKATFLHLPYKKNAGQRESRFPSLEHRLSLPPQSPACLADTLTSSGLSEDAEEEGRAAASPLSLTLTLESFVFLYQSMSSLMLVEL